MTKTFGLNDLSEMSKLKFFSITSLYLSYLSDPFGKKSDALVMIRSMYIRVAVAMMLSSCPKAVTSTALVLQATETVGVILTVSDLIQFSVFKPGGDGE